MSSVWYKSLSSDVIARLQAAQDAMAELAGVSLSILDGEGNACTIPSREPLFCTRTQTEIPGVCLQNRRQTVKQTTRHLKAVTYLCHSGLTSAVVPLGVSWEGGVSTPSAFLVVGKVMLEDEDHPNPFLNGMEPLLTEGNVSVMSSAAFRKTVAALGNMFDLLFVVAATGGLIAHVPWTDGVEGLEKPQLTKRERQIANMVGTGMSNQDIASKLFISDKTVKSHITNILNKLHLKNRTELALFVVQALGRGSSGVAI